MKVRFERAAFIASLCGLLRCIQFRAFVTSSTDPRLRLPVARACTARLVTADRQMPERTERDLAIDEFHERLDFLSCVAPSTTMRTGNVPRSTRTASRLALP